MGNKKSSAGKVAIVIDGVTKTKTSLAKSALKGATGLSKGSKLAIGLLGLPGYTISLGLRAYEDSKEEGWTQALTTEAMQDSFGALTALGVTIATENPVAGFVLGYVGQHETEELADAIYEGVVNTFNNAGEQNMQQSMQIGNDLFSDIHNYSDEQNTFESVHNEENNEQAQLSSRNNNSFMGYNSLNELSRDENSISNNNNEESTTTNNQPNNSNVFGNYQFSFEATKTALANISKISVPNNFSSVESMSVNNNSPLGGSFGYSGDGDYGKSNGFDGSDNTAGVDAVSLKGTFTGAFKEVFTNTTKDGDAASNTGSSKAPAGVTGVAAAAVAAFSPALAAASIFGGIVSGLADGIAAGSVSKGISTAVSNIGRGFATIAKGVADAFSGLFGGKSKSTNNDASLGGSFGWGGSGSYGGASDSSSDSGGSSCSESGGWGRPIIMDLDGDGVELVSVKDSSAYYDIDGDGTRNKIGWAGSDDGLLAYDKDGNNNISKKEEISFVDYVKGAKTDLEGLHHFDTNKDGKLDKNDKEFAKFGVWQDKNQNGLTDKGEFKSLDKVGIASMGLKSDNKKEIVEGNKVAGYGNYIKTNGTSLKFSDTALKYSKTDIKPGTKDGVKENSSKFRSIAYRDYTGLKSTSITGKMNNTPFSANEIEIFGS